MVKTTNLINAAAVLQKIGSVKMWDYIINRLPSGRLSITTDTKYLVISPVFTQIIEIKRFILEFFGIFVS